MSGALAGTKVIDLTQMLAGPYCTMMLADHGAEVIKIEPVDGDPTRHFGPFPADDTAHHFGGYFQSTNRNKFSLALDLKKPEGKDLLIRLVRGADILVENFRAGVMDRLGLGYEKLAAENPRLIYASIRGFGDPRTGASPHVDRPAFDVVAQAMGGAMGITGPDASTPIKIGPGVGDIFPAALAAFGILAAYHHAVRTGEGQFVDVAMYDSVVSLCERMVYQYSYTGRSPVPEGNRHPILCPFGTFSARDGQVTIGCPRDSFWVELVGIMRRPELAADPRFRTNNDRLAHREETVALVEDWTRSRSKAEIAEALGSRVPFGPVNTAADIYADPHMAARDMLVEVEHPGSSAPVTIASTPIRMTATPGGVVRRAPIAGEHTDDVLHSLGVSADEIASLRAAQIVA
jgi:crotonobetainyl-CoA:carnitine CoA-transferase CaiB-like acyl-CoA transferase